MPYCCWRSAQRCSGCRSTPKLALDDWKAELRSQGARTQAVVHDRVTKDGGNRSSPSTTMYFRYEVAGRTHQTEVGCVEVCRVRGETVTIWVNRADPGDFVTDFDQLSGHRGRVQGVLGAVGFGLLVVAVPLVLSRLPLRRWFRRPPPKRPGSQVRDAEADGGKPFTGRSKHKRGSRR